MKKFAESFLRFDLVFSLVCIFGLNIFVFAQAEVKTLTLGESAEREIINTEAHKYKINVPGGNYLVVKVEQKVDVIVTVFDADGKKIKEVDNPYGIQLAETVYLIAETSADYLLEVKILDPKSKPGNYQIKIETLRTATEDDKIRIAAEAGLLNGDLAYIKNTAEGYKIAEETYKNALPLFQSLGDKRREYYIIDRLGRVMNQIGDKKKSQEYYFQALELGKKTGDKTFIARSIGTIGSSYFTQGENRKAIEYWTQALELYKENDNKNMAVSMLNNIGAAYGNLGEYIKSLEYYNQVLQPMRDLGMRLEEAYVVRNIGLAYSNLGDDLKCLEYLAEALKISREIKDRRHESMILYNTGLTNSSLGDEAKAVEFYNQTLVIQKETGNKFGEIGTLNILGYSYYKLSDYQKALEFLDQGYELNKTLQLRNLEASLNYQTGLVYTGLKNYAKARELFAKARADFAFMETAVQMHRADYMMAQIAFEEEKFDEAQAKMKPILEFFESSRKQVIQPDQRSVYFSTAQTVYEFYIKLLMAKYQKQADKNAASEAFYTSERTRARSLLEMLAQSKIDLRENADPEMLLLEQNLRQQIGNRASRLTRLLSGKFTEEQKTAAEKELENLRRQHTEIEAKLLTGNKRYAELVQPSPLSLKEVQRQVLDADTALIEYSLGKEKSFVFIITKDSFEAFEISENEKIEKTARQVYELLTARNKIVKFETAEEKRRRIETADKEYPAAAADLSNLILNPAKNALTKKRLLVVADGILQYIPFAALPLRTGEPLIVNHEVVTLPSASTLAVLRKETAGRTTAPKMVAVLADPIFNTDDERYQIIVSNRKNQPKIEQIALSKTRSVNLRGTDDLTRTVRDFSGGDSEFVFSRLPFTRKEADAITNLVPPAQKKIALDFAANRANALNADLAQYQIIHFATHSFINSRTPELSGIVLSLIDENGKPQDGFLRSDEIYNLDLNADLVVLSGCRTGLGKQIRGEGLIGLTRGFMYAGAKRVVVSLWDVNDEATSELMTHFYREMLGTKKLSPSSSLRLAQISMLKNKRWNNPYYWATFTLQGEPR